ncbi:glycosyltransferase [Pseudolabrys taiwanensis]|uniref:glycosyltransferase n=1 Tax=Pseudolabrys taiwanensis TaxID=331696 RepID=UPI001FDEE373|nr:glycosyltransferase [Pseudolabrys taiwanensis]
MSSLPVSEAPKRPQPMLRDVARPDGRGGEGTFSVLIVTPTLDGGASDAGAVELTRVLAQAGYRAIVVSQAGRLVADVSAMGARFVPLDVGSNNPAVMLRNAFVLMRLVHDERVGAIHVFGRSAAWSACIAARPRRVPVLTSWFKGFREQNVFKHYYNGVMARGDRVLAASEQIAQLINDRYGTPWDKIAVVPCSIDLDRFDPTRVSQERIDAMRHVWGVSRDTKVILITGRILRRKGHTLAVKAAKRLKEMGLKDFLFVFVGEDRGRTHYTGELWDLALATGTMDVIRMAAPVADMPAAYAAAAVVASAAVQPEGAPRAILEAQAMARPVIVSDLAAGPDVVLTAPSVPESRVAGLRFQSGDDAAFAAALLRLFAMPEPNRAMLGQRGRDWVLGHFDRDTVAEQILRIYRDLGAADAARKRAGI